MMELVWLSVNNLDNSQISSKVCAKDSLDSCHEIEYQVIQPEICPAMGFSGFHMYVSRL